MENLDLKCAKLGRELAQLKIDGKFVEEKVFTNALGVLEEQGPYACFLNLQAREGGAGREITQKATKFLQQTFPDTNAGDPLKFIRHLASNLDNLLFARDLLRQVFVYARYHAKARENSRGQS